MEALPTAAGINHTGQSYASPNADGPNSQCMLPIAPETASGRKRETGERPAGGPDTEKRSKTPPLQHGENIFSKLH
jgi:hypothetical protein